MDAAEERRFREFVSARSPALMRLAFLLTGGDQHAAEDLLQTALARTVTRWSRVETPEAYVRQAMYRQQGSWWRRRGETVVAGPPEGTVADGTYGADLRRALARLTPRQRAVLVLRYYEDLPEAEVAGILGPHRPLARRMSRGGPYGLACAADVARRTAWTRLRGGCHEGGSHGLACAAGVARADRTSRST